MTSPRRTMKLSLFHLAPLAALLSFAAVTYVSEPLAQAAPVGSSSDPVASARMHFARGVKLYEEDDFRAALIEYNRAHELAPNWAVLYNVGQAHYQLRDYANALRTLERYVREGGARIDAERRAQVDREIDELRGRVARVRVLVNVDGAAVALDDSPLERPEVGEAVLVGAGRHRFTASKAGYVSAVRVVDIAGGDDLGVVLDLAAETTTPVRSSDARSYVATGFALAIGVVGVGVGSAFGVAAMENKSSLNRDCNARKECPSSEQGVIDGFARNGAISTAGFGVGAAGLAFGAYLFFHERSKQEKPSPSLAEQHVPQRVFMTPWVGLGAGGVFGTF